MLCAASIRWNIASIAALFDSPTPVLLGQIYSTQRLMDSAWDARTCRQ
jgi:hypothetical protein